MAFFWRKKLTIADILEKYELNAPHFSDGRVDYTHSRRTPIIMCFVKFGDEMIVVKRSDLVHTYKQAWSTVTAYVDNNISLRHHVLHEVQDELGVMEQDIFYAKSFQSFKYYDAKLQHTWIVFPYVIELNKKVKVKIDWEHTAFKWIKFDELQDFKFPDHVMEAIKTIPIRQRFFGETLAWRIIPYFSVLVVLSTLFMLAIQSLVFIWTIFFGVIGVYFIFKYLIYRRIFSQFIGNGCLFLGGVSVFNLFSKIQVSWMLIWLFFLILVITAFFYEKRYVKQVGSCYRRKFI